MPAGSGLDGRSEGDAPGRVGGCLSSLTERREVSGQGVRAQLDGLETVAQLGQVVLDSEGIRVCHRLNLARRGARFSDGDQPVRSSHS